MSAAQVWLVQLLCPSRHCIVASPYMPGPTARSTIETWLKGRMQAMGVNHWCGLCGSSELRFAHAQTRYTDWDEAVAALRTEEQKQAVTRQLLRRD